MCQAALCKCIEPVVFCIRHPSGRKDSVRLHPIGTTCHTQEIPFSQGQALRQKYCCFKPHLVLMDAVLGFCGLKETLGEPPVSLPVSPLIIYTITQTSSS